MLSLIDGQYYDLAPIPAPVGEPCVRFHAPSVSIHAFVGANRIFVGPRYFSYSKSADIDPVTGKITVNSAGRASFRVVFGEFHIDVEQEFAG